MGVHRASLRNLLQSYIPSDLNEQHYKTQMLEFLSKYPDCFERFLEVGHFTASAWLLDKDGTKALLMHHAKLGGWFQLGGHSDGNPNLLEVAIKEASEESGLENIQAISTDIFDIDIHLIPENAKEKVHFHYDVRFLLRHDGSDVVKINHESKELRWIDQQIANLPTTDPSVLRMHQKWIQFLALGKPKIQF